MLDEITITREQFNCAFDEVLDTLRQAAEETNNPMAFLKFGLFTTIMHAELEHILFKEEKLEVTEDKTDGN